MPSVGTSSRIEGWTVGGDDDRLAIIRRQVFQAVETGEAGAVLWTARAITAQCPSKDHKCELHAIHSAVRHGPLPVPLDNGQVVTVPGIRFVEECRWTDMYNTAWKTLEAAARGSNGGDCDDFVILICSLLLVLGWLPGAVITSKDGRIFDHIFAVAGFPKDSPNIWVPLDATIDRPVGWWPPRTYVRRMRVYGFTAHPYVVGREVT